tara:strand:- start:1349 stop:1594 length:246 start_codon:yes stop_codon:yes gene_type:complete
MKKGFNSIQEQVQEIWAITDLELAKEKLIGIVNNDLHKSTRESKYKFVESIKKCKSLDRLYLLSSNINFQDDKSTASFKYL